MNVKSTYNFVPAPDEDKVYKPDWANKVSHDIPFSDGESGEITIKITAKTPIFIRNGHSKEDGENKTDRYQSFSKAMIGGVEKYFIPGTSIKGMIRNMVEIMGKGRLRRVSNDRYAYRDLTKGSEYMRNYKSKDVEAGWLYEKDGNWFIKTCGKPGRISHEDIDNILGTNFRTQFLNRNPDPDYKIAKGKYDAVGNKKLKYNFRYEQGDNKLLAIKDDESPEEGTIVFTGQSGKRNEQRNPPSGKLYEFVFPEVNGEIEVPKEDQKDFKFIYLDHDRNNISEDWKYWKAKLKNGQDVPVFYTYKDGKLKHFGLAYMYKLPYKKSIHETAPYSDYSFEKMDLAETIFGKVEDEAYKGRVMFGHAFSENAESSHQVVKEILGSPRASYFPFYLDQKGGRLTTYNDSNAKLRGFKRYPVHKSIKTGNYDEKQKDKVFSKFIPLKTGAEFTEKIRFHNLRKIEIGALISALTFHNHSGYSHSLGGAKPFGYGKVKIEIEGNSLKHDIAEYLAVFEEEMGGDNWLLSSSMIELFAMAQISSDERRLVYPSLDEFVEYKKGKKYLKNYAGITEKPSIKTAKSPEYLAKKEKEAAERQERFNTKIQLGEQYLSKNDFEKAKKAFTEANEISNDGNLTARLRKVEDKKAKYEKDNAIEKAWNDAKSLNTRDAYKAFVNKYPNSKYQEEYNKIMRVFDAEERANNRPKPEDDSFRSLQKEIIEKLQKKNKSYDLTDNQKNEVEILVKKSFAHEKNRGKKNEFLKRKKPAKFTDFPWTDIAKWLGEERAEKLFNELNSK